MRGNLRRTILRSTVPPVEDHAACGVRARASSRPGGQHGADIEESRLARPPSHGNRAQELIGAKLGPPSLSARSQAGFAVAQPPQNTPYKRILGVALSGTALAVPRGLALGRRRLLAQDGSNEAVIVVQSACQRGGRPRPKEAYRVLSDAMRSRSAYEQAPTLSPPPCSTTTLNGGSAARPGGVNSTARGKDATAPTTRALNPTRPCAAPFVNSVR